MPNEHLVQVQSILSKTDTFGTDTKCPSLRDVCLIESQVKRVKEAATNLKCLFYKDVCHIEVSVKRESTVHGQNTELR